VALEYSTLMLPAIQQLYTYMTEVANEDLPDLNIHTYIGIPTEADVNNPNTISLGQWSGLGSGILGGYSSTWESFAAGAKVRAEPFALRWSIVAWAGSAGSDPTQSDALLNVFAMYNAFVGRIVNDPTGSGNLGGSGQWLNVSADLPVYGPVEKGGVQAVLEGSVTAKGLAEYKVGN
jgi:hypothetical protein